MKRVHLFVSGRVQGVTFRYSTRKKARHLGVNGWVKNLDDGRVEVVAEGEDDAVDELVNHCSKGPIFAKVKDIEVEEEKYQDEFEEFSVRY